MDVADELRKVGGWLETLHLDNEVTHRLLNELVVILREDEAEEQAEAVKEVQP